jgi:hypothetical protein
VARVKYDEPREDAQWANAHSVIQKGDVIEAVIPEAQHGKGGNDDPGNAIDLRQARSVAAAGATLRTALQQDGSVTLRVLAARLYDDVHDKGCLGCTLHENFLPDGGSDSEQGVHALTPWQQFSRNRRIAGWSPRFGGLLAAFRLLFWHWLQPAVYWLSLLLYWDQLAGQADGNLQLKLALAVGLREALYVPITWLALVYSPSFLLLDNAFDYSRLLSRDTADRGGAKLANCIAAMYGFTPEKMVLAMGLSELMKDSGGLRCLEMGDGSLLALVLTLSGLVFFALDACACVAFVVGVSYGNLPEALAVGYSFTALSGLVALPALVVGVYAFVFTAVDVLCKNACCTALTDWFFNCNSSADDAKCCCIPCGWCKRYFDNEDDDESGEANRPVWEDSHSLVYTRHAGRRGYGSLGAPKGQRAGVAVTAKRMDGHSERYTFPAGAIVQDLQDRLLEALDLGGTGGGESGCEDAPDGGQRARPTPRPNTPTGGCDGGPARDPSSYWPDSPPLVRSQPTRQRRRQPEGEVTVFREGNATSLHPRAPLVDQEVLFALPSAKPSELLTRQPGRPRRCRSGSDSDDSVLTDCTASTSCDSDLDPADGEEDEEPSESTVPSFELVPPLPRGAQRASARSRGYCGADRSRLYSVPGVLVVRLLPRAPARSIEYGTVHAVPTAVHPHALKNDGADSSTGWRCDGPGCRSGDFDSHDWGAVDRFKCVKGCDFHLCRQCMRGMSSQPAPAFCSASAAGGLK